MSINIKEFIWFGKNLFCSDFDEFSRWLANMFLLIAAAVLSIAYAEQGEKDNDFLFQKTRFRNRQKYRESLKNPLRLNFRRFFFGCLTKIHNALAYYRIWLFQLLLCSSLIQVLKPMQEPFPQIFFLHEKWWFFKIKNMQWRMYLYVYWWLYN